MKAQDLIIYSLSIPVLPYFFMSELWKILRGKSMVVLGERAAGKTAFLWQLGFIPDKKENPEKGFSPNDYQQTEISPRPVRVDILKKGEARITQYQDTGGPVEQHINGGYKPFIKENDYIFILFDGNKFISSLSSYEKDLNTKKKNYVFDCMGIFQNCYNLVKEYNEKWYHWHEKHIVVIASHLDEYKRGENEMKRIIKQWAGQKDYKKIFNHFYCMILNDPAQKENNQEKFNLIMREL